MKSKKTNRNAKGSGRILTVRELKTWLDGYCSAHDNDWSPNAEQWNMIRDKIFSLEDGTAAPAPSYVAPAPAYSNPPPQPNRPTYSDYGNALPLPPSGMIPEAASSAGAGSSMVGLTDRPGTIIRDGKIITPSKETPGGPSDFA